MSALDGGEWSASLPAAVHPAKEPRYPKDGRLGGSQSRFGRCGGKKEKILDVGYQVNFQDEIIIYNSCII